MNDPKQFLSEAEAMLGPRGFTHDIDLVAPWLTDWRGRYTGKALAMASPSSTSQVSEFVGLCAKHRVAIVPQGGNSGMSGGATPNESGEAILLSLRRMNAIRHIDVDSRQTICEAGVILQTLHEDAAEHRLRFPLTLGGKGSATIGGLIATNAGGTQVLRYGSMRAQVLGIEAVLPDGGVFDSLTVLKKDNRGFDLKQLLIGSEGTLGIITAATLQLLPEMGGRIVAWAGLDSLQTAQKLLQYCQDTMGTALEGFEVMPRRCLSAVLDHLPHARNPLSTMHPWNALIELVAPTGGIETLLGNVEQLFGDAGELNLYDDAVLANNEAQAEKFWHLRDSVSAAERAIGPATQHDISVPVAAMPDFIDHAIPTIESKFAGTQAIAFGHLGDGNVHFHVLAPAGADRGEWESGDGKEISAFVHDLVTQWGGSISAEHGIGQMKRDELQRLGDPVALGLMRSIKQALDPLGIMNPGKLLTMEVIGESSPLPPLASAVSTP